MTMITQLIRNIQIIAAVIIIILLVFCGIGLYLFKFKKRTVKEQALDYSSFNRKEVVDYIGFTIKSTPSRLTAFSICSMCFLR